MTRTGGQDEPPHLQLRLYGFKERAGIFALLDVGTEIEVSANLPKAFTILTPVGGYTPDVVRLFS